MRELESHTRPTVVSYTEDDRLQTCPRCGRNPHALIIKNIFRQTASVGCTHCAGTINIERPAKYEGDIEQEIIDLWNEK